MAAAAAAVFIVCVAVHWLAYRRILDAGLRQPAIEERRRALKRWTAFAVGFQGLVVVAVATYALLSLRGHPSGYSWILPPLGAVLGAALPLQLAVSRIVGALRA